MTKRILTLLFLLALTMGLAMRASADIGPKPSVVLEFSGLEGRQYAATLLGDTESYGPWSADADYREWNGERAVWDAFCAYDAPEGWHFLGNFADCTETHRFAWSYYPPQRFYVLLYFMDTGEYWRSPQPYERYAFHSAFAVQVDGMAGAVRPDYPYARELASLAFRAAATVAVELAVAWAFGLRSRRHIRLILRVNLVTQVLLNVALNLCNYKSGPWMFWFMYLWLELAVFGIEGFVYARCFPAAQDKRERHPWLYALAANAASYGVGALIAAKLPGLF